MFRNCNIIDHYVYFNGEKIGMIISKKDITPILILIKGILGKTEYDFSEAYNKYLNWIPSVTDSTEVS
jgi:hypothetical protein